MAGRVIACRGCVVPCDRSWGAAVDTSCRSRPDASVAATHPPRVRSPQAGLRGTAAAAPPGAQANATEMHASKESAPVKRRGWPGEGPVRGPLRRLRTTPGRALDRAVERLRLGEDGVDDAREFRSDDGARDDGGLATAAPLIERTDLREVLDRPHGGQHARDPGALLSPSTSAPGRRRRTTQLLAGRPSRSVPPNAALQTQVPMSTCIGDSGAATYAAATAKGCSGVSTA